MSAVGMGTDSFYNGRELDIAAVYFFEEMLEVKRIIAVEVVHNRQCVPFHSVLVQQADALHYFHKLRTSLPVLPVFVVELLRTVA